MNKDSLRTKIDSKIKEIRSSSDDSKVADIVDELLLDFAKIPVESLEINKYGKMAAEKEILLYIKSIKEDNELLRKGDETMTHMNYFQMVLNLELIDVFLKW